MLPRVLETDMEPGYELGKRRHGNRVVFHGNRVGAPTSTLSNLFSSFLFSLSLVVSSSCVFAVCLLCICACEVVFVCVV